MNKLAIGCGTICGIFIIAFICFAIWFNSMIDDSLSKKEIFDLVNDNYTTLLRDINEKDFSDTSSLSGVREVYSENEIIDVYCGGTGIGSATSYYGFYYSPDNQPKTTWCGSDFGDNSKLQADGKGFSIKYSNDDNCYYTEKIRDNFYYYEVHF